MMTPWLEPVQLAIQHVRDRRERVPVGVVNMGKGPLNIAWTETANDPWVGVNVRTIIVVYEAVVQRLAKHDPGDPSK